MNNDRLKFRVFYGGDYSITPYCTIDMNGKVWLDTSIMRGDGLGDFDTDIIDITDKCTVEQCTGLRDINGNLIYAGDRGILTVFGGIGPNGGYVDSDKQVNVQVEWVDECAGFYFVDDNGICYDMTNNTENFEIVGNIHEQKDVK